MQVWRQACRPRRKLLSGRECFELVTHMLRERLSPEQIAGKHAPHEHPRLRDAYVYHDLQRDLRPAGR